MAVTLTQGVAAASFAFTSNVTAADTVLIGDVTYVFAADPSGTPFEVDVGSDLDDSIGNLVAAINLSGTDDDEYGVGTTANPYVTAAADLGNDEIDLTARIIGNQINGMYLAATSPGGNDIAAAAVVFSSVSGGTDGVGSLSDFVDSIEDDGMQPNSQILTELHRVSEAVD